VTLLFWGIVLGTIAYVVCRWRETGRKITDAQRTLSPEYEAARRRHPSSLGNPDQPTTLAHRFVWNDEPQPEPSPFEEHVSRHFDDALHGHYDPVPDEVDQFLAGLQESEPITRQQLDEIKTRTMDAVRRLDKGEQA